MGVKDLLIARILGDTFFDTHSLAAAVESGWHVGLASITASELLGEQIAAVTAKSLGDPGHFSIEDLLAVSVQRDNWRWDFVQFILSEDLAGLDTPAAAGFSTLLYCQFASKSPAGSLASQADLKKIVKDRVEERGRVLAEEMEGTLAVFRSPAAAISSALTIQRQSHAAAGQVTHGIALGLHLAGGAETDVVADGSAAQIAKQIATIADAGQILTSTGVRDAASGADFGIPQASVAWTLHRDYVLRTGGIRELHEVTDIGVRQPAEPRVPPEAMALPASKFLEDRGFTNLRRLTSGGGAILYRAERLVGGERQTIAVKVLFEGLGQDERLRSEFLQRARDLKALSNDGIVRVLDIGEESIPYFVMDWLEGQHFDVAFNATSGNKQLALAIKLAKALAYAHSKGVLHGDLKPSNIIVVGDQPILLDFGQLDWAVRKGATETRGRVGTPRYVAPELARDGGPITKSSDVYSLGVILYEAFVGRPPFDSAIAEVVLNAHINIDPPWPSQEKPGFNPTLERIILKAMEKIPGTENGPPDEQRYPDVAPLLVDLDHCRKGEPIRTRPSIYNNMIQTRARAAVDQIEAWKAAGHLTEGEHGRLRRAFNSLLRTGISAVAESRLTHLPIVFLYLSGALVISGVTALLSRHASTLGDQALLRAIIGLALPAVTGAAWFGMRKIGRYRAAFVLGLLTLIGVPVATANLLHEVNRATLQLPAVAVWADQALMSDPAQISQTSGTMPQGTPVDFGSNASTWAHNGLCEDARFEGPRTLQKSLIKRDASDCKALLDAKLLRWNGPAGIVVAGQFMPLGYEGDWDGMCSDTRFSGPGFQEQSSPSQGLDAYDCKVLYEKGEVQMSPPASIELAGQTIILGDDAGYANDGACDDNRFRTAEDDDVSPSDPFHDATDCRQLLEQGAIELIPPLTEVIDGVEIMLGDDSSKVAHNGVCNDPRFEGPGSSFYAGAAEVGHDATDCAAQLAHGLEWIGEGRVPPPGALVYNDGGRVALGDDLGPFAINGVCEDTEFQSTWKEVIAPGARLHDATDCAYMLTTGTQSYSDIEEKEEESSALAELLEAHYLNWQIAIGLALAFLWAEFISVRSRTVTVSVVSSLLLGALCVVLLDFLGLKHLWVDTNRHLLGLFLLLTAAAVLAYAWYLAPGTKTKPVDAGSAKPGADQTMTFNRLAIPFINVALLFVVFAAGLLSESLPRYWGLGEDQFLSQCCLFALSGAVLYGLALWIRQRLKIDAATSYWTLIFIALGFAYFGFLVADECKLFGMMRYVMPGTTCSAIWWPALPIPGSASAGSLGLLGMAGVAIFALVQSVSLNSRLLMAVAVAAASGTVWYVEWVHFPGRPGWAYLLILVGIAGAIALLLRLMRLRDLHDIDDLAQQLYSRKK